MLGIMTDDGGTQTMTIAILPCAEGRLTLNLSPWPDLSEEDFFQLCAANPDLRLERTAKGEIVIMAPAGGASSNRNFNIVVALAAWTQEDGTGVGFDSSAGFQLPDGSVLGPDAAWVRRERLSALSADQRERFLPLAPDFVIELRSPSDRPRDLETKMAAYAANGVRLGWLIDPFAHTITVYRPGKDPELLRAPERITGDPELPGFVLEMEGIWRDPRAT